MGNGNSEHPGGAVDPIGARDLLPLVVEKLSSQALLFGLAIVVIVAALSWLLRDNASLLFPVLALVLVVFIFASVGYLFVEQRQRVSEGEPAAARQVLGGKMAMIENPQQAFEIELWTQAKATAAARDIGIVPQEPTGEDSPFAEADGHSYAIGDKVLVNFRSTRDCYLTLLNIGTSGKLTILFPNAIYPDNHVPANQLVTIPGEGYGFDYQLQGPPGVERLKAVATLQPVQLLESNFSADGTVFTTREGGAAARDIATIRQTVEKLPGAEWAEATGEFSVA